MKDAPNIDKMLYQLQGYRYGFVNKASTQENTMWVLDQYRFNTFDVIKIKTNNNLVIAYMSIGEAESYRSYFKKLDKNLILEENKDWKENFTVKYWEQQWHDIIVHNEDSYTATLAKIGFDGVYLDIVDGFHRFPDKKLRATQMAQLIIAISKRGREFNPKFRVYLQNGIDIINYIDKETKGALFDAITGGSIEGYFFEYVKNKNERKSDFFKTFEPIYREYQDQGKEIYIVEYVKDTKLRKDLFDYCNKNKIKCLVTDRALKGKIFESN